MVPVFPEQRISDLLYTVQEQVYFHYVYLLLDVHGKIAVVN